MRSTTPNQVIAEIEAGPRGPEVAAVFELRDVLVGNRERPRDADSAVADLAGRDLAEVTEEGARAFLDGWAGDLRHDVWWLVKAHQRCGHTVVIATDALEPDVVPVAEALGVGHVVCARPAEVDGVLTGTTAGVVPRGRHKFEAVTRLLGGLGVELAHTHAYATADDLPLLSAVGHPHPVRIGNATGSTPPAWPVLRLPAVGTGRLDPRPALRTAGFFGSLVGSAGLGIVSGVLRNDRRRGVDLTTSVFDGAARPLTGVRIEVTGEQHARSHRPAVFFINHQSTLVDFLVVTRVIRSGFTAVAKAEVKQMPVVGPLFDLAGVAFLDRADRTRAIDALRPVVETLRSGVSVVMAPEGTRSPTPRLGRFKKGGFHMAMQAEVPIVPIVIRNAGEIMWRNAKTIRAGTVQVAVLPPVHTTGWRVDELDGHVAAMRGLYERTLENWPA